VYDEEERPQRSTLTNLSTDSDQVHQAQYGTESSNRRVGSSQSFIQERQSMFKSEDGRLLDP
jgi:hypothetical protein